jgi:hypothetical protein
MVVKLFFIHLCKFNIFNAFFYYSVFMRCPEFWAGKSGHLNKIHLFFLW